MLAFQTITVATILLAVPQGYVIDCRSCPENVPRVNIVVQLVAKDGTKFTTGKIQFVTDPLNAQSLLVAAIEDSDFIVRKGENDTVIIFGPKGQSLKSIKFESEEWKPVYRRFYGK